MHRIDKDTSGLLVVAKRPETKAHLARQFFDKTTHRSYRALVWGRFTEPKGTIVRGISDETSETAYRWQSTQRAVSGASTQ